MKQEKVLNKEGQVLTTKEGVELTNNFLELGDVFIPLHNNIIEKRRVVLVKGKERTITDYKVVAKVKCNGKVQLNHEEKSEFFLTLTPTQAKALKSKIEAGVEINQHEFRTYEYVNDYGEQVGVGLKRDEKPAIDFSSDEE